MNIESTSTTRIHHPYSPSKLQPLEACSKYQSRFTESEAAAMGTLQHDVAESGIDDARLPDFKAAAVVDTMRFVDERFALYPGGQLLKEQYLPVDEEVVEVRDEIIEELTDPEDPDSGTTLTQTYKKFVGSTAGYLDVGIISADELTLEVIDFKYGRVAVEQAGNNLQGYAYLLGLKKKFPKAARGLLWFTMPHRDEITGAEFNLVTQKLVAVYTSETGWVPATGDTASMYLRIRTIVARAIEANKVEDDYSMANPTESGCLFCARLGKCPKVAEIALKIGKKFRPLDVPPSLSTTIFRDPKETATGIKVAAVLKQWADSFRAGATAKSIAEDFIPDNYVLVSTTKRNVADARKLGDLAKTFLADPKMHEQVEKLFDISIGPLEKLISLASPRGKKEATVDEFGKKALEAGALVEGQPFAFLRQSGKE